MREFYLFTVLFLFCTFSLAAQEVPFEGLHLDELILSPRERKPAISGLLSPSLKNHVTDLPGCESPFLLPGSPKSLFVKSLRTRITFPILTAPKYKLTDKLSFRLSTNKVDDGNRSLRHLYTTGVGGELNYQLSKRFELKAGMSYQYNIALKCWEWTYQTGIIFRF